MSTRVAISVIRILIYIFNFTYLFYLDMSSHMHAWHPYRPEEGFEFLWMLVIDSCELCKCWELNPFSLEEQPVFLLTEPSL